MTNDDKKKTKILCSRCLRMKCLLRCVRLYYVTASNANSDLHLPGRY